MFGGCLFNIFWVVQGRVGDVLGGPLGALGLCSGGAPGYSWGCVWVLLGCSCTLLGLSWAALGQRGTALVFFVCFSLRHCLLLLLLTFLCASFFPRVKAFFKSCYTFKEIW